MREWLARLRDWFRRDQLDAELAEELRFHQALLARDARARGPEASAGAHGRLGNLTRVREDARERWSVPWLDHLQQDVRYALRGLRRSPGFAAAVVLTLGLGIGANASMFSIIDRLMFRPLAYLRDPDTVHRVYWQWQQRGATTTRLSTQYARFRDLSRWTTSFSSLAGFFETDLAVGEGESAQERRVGAVSASFFGFFDAQPALGRFFAADEDVTPRGADVAVLSYVFWQSQFGGRDVLGELLPVGNVRATIVGVAPEGFNGVGDASPPAVYIPITSYAGSGGTTDARTYFTRYQWGWMQVLVRRKAGISLAQANADATNAFRRSWVAARADDPTNPSADVALPRAVVSSVRPGAGPDPSLETRTAIWVTIVAAIVLLIACANVANLFLARSLSRGRETALRLALGVRRGRLVRQSITESLTLALIGGAAALLVAQWAGASIRGMLISTTAPMPVAADTRTFVVTFLLVLATGVVVGLVPPLVAGRADVARTLRGGGRGIAEGSRLRSALLVVQATLSVVLLIGAVLFVRSLAAVRAMPMGYDIEHVLLVNRVNRGTEITESSQRSMRRVLETAAQSLPGVESEAWLSTAPFLSTSSVELHVPGLDSASRLGSFTFTATTPGYFRTMGTRIVRGRGFSGDDRLGAPMVAIVSESMARALWPGQEALGRCFRMRADTAPCVNVVGIAEDMVQQEIATTQRFHYYVLLDQYTRTWGNWMALRLRGDPAVDGERIRAALQRVMPGASYVTVRPLGTVVQDAQRSWRLGATMFVAFGVLALVVAAVGLYGVIAYNVATRMHELGIRLALGAQRRAILALVVGHGARFACVGIVLGMLLAGGASRALEPLLFRQSATDPVVYGGVAATMFVVAVVACLLPAVWAARIDPSTALRSE